MKKTRQNKHQPNESENKIINPSTTTTLTLTPTPTPTSTQTNRRRRFAPIKSLQLPPGMEKIMTSIQVPFQAVQKMMADEDKLIEEDKSAQNLFHSMRL